MTLVWQETREPLYAQRVAETIGWLEREMTHRRGRLLLSSLDADSEHEEGKFYVWSEAEIDAVLGERAALFKRIYDVTAEGNWEGQTSSTGSSMPELADENTEARARAVPCVAPAGARAAGPARAGTTRCSPIGTG